MSSLTLSRKHSGALSKAQLFLVILALAGLQLLFTLHLRMSAPPPAEPDPDQIEAYNPELFKVMSFGQLPAVIDWMWIKTLENPVITHVKRGTHPGIFYTLDLVTNLDPAFMEAYTQGATLVSVIRDDGPGALHLLLRGEDFRKKELPGFTKSFRQEYWRNEWQLPLLLAYVYLFDMDDMPHAAQAFEEASRITGAPYYLPDLVRKLKEPDGQYKVGLRLTDFMIAGATDPDVKHRLLVRRASLQVGFFIHQMNERHQKNLGLPPTDPWGGKVSVDSNGKVVTTTPHMKVFGLE